MDLSISSLVVDFTKMGFGIGIATKEYLDSEIEDGTLFEVVNGISNSNNILGIIPAQNVKAGEEYTKYKEIQRSMEHLNSIKELDDDIKRLKGKK